MTFTASRAAGLDRLADFVPRSGAYAGLRNYDLPDHPHVSRLSPWLRHRLVTEEEVLTTVLDRYARSTVDKFVQEVVWRTYWKGWLEQRPSVWTKYNAGLRGAWDRVQTSSGLRDEWEAACRGDTGIACFDHWARELADTGYLHNHARMWFASIWIFTLRLPWELGADFFLRHLLDGDPASNTLGWRWVGGLQTRGKTYLARASNIARYTEGRFNPAGQLAQDAAPLDGPENPPRQPIAPSGVVRPGLRTGVLLTYEDCTPTHVAEAVTDPAAFARIEPDSTTAVLHISPAVQAFRTGALDDAVSRWPGGPAFSPLVTAAELVAWATESGLRQVVTATVPVGPMADLLAEARPMLDRHDIALVELRRDYDSLAWPWATAGFFKFRERIPQLLDTLDMRQMSLSL